MASKIKGRPPKQPKVTPALPSNDSQQLHENNPGKTPQGEGGGEEMWDAEQLEGGLGGR